MIIQNPLVPPVPTANGNAAATVANAPPANQQDEAETGRPVTASERAERPNAEDRAPPEPLEEAQTDTNAERGGQLDITV